MVLATGIPESLSVALSMIYAFPELPQLLTRSGLF